MEAIIFIVLLFFESNCKSVHAGWSSFKLFHYVISINVKVFIGIACMHILPYPSPHIKSLLITKAASIIRTPTEILVNPCDKQSNRKL